MHPGRVGQDLPGGENSVMAQIFLNQFIRVQGNYLARDFRAPGWVHPAQKLWWKDLTLNVLDYFGEDLMRVGL